MAADSEVPGEVQLAPDRPADPQFSSPDEYAKTKKLEAIYRRKEHFDELVSQINGRDNEAPYLSELTVALWQYANELMPVIRAGLDNDVITKSDVQLADSIDGDVFDFVMTRQFPDDVTMVEVPDGRYPHAPALLEMYRVLTDVQNQLGIGVSISSSNPPMQL
jgi:hypothetical protein